jgi:hypothetical protein
MLSNPVAIHRLRSIVTDKEGRRSFSGYFCPENSLDKDPWLDRVRRARTCASHTASGVDLLGSPSVILFEKNSLDNHVDKNPPRECVTLSTVGHAHPTIGLIRSHAFGSIPPFSRGSAEVISRASSLGTLRIFAFRLVRSTISQSRILHRNCR